VDGSLAAFVPGLLLAGAGVGLCFTPLTAIVLGNVDPERAGVASGVLSTTQQVGYSLGVAITGVIFFGARNDIARALELSLIELAVLAVGVAAASRLLPGAGRAARPEAPRPVGQEAAY
jgi:MFS family permease